MSEVINGVPRELLERAERNLCSGEEAYRTQQDLRALLTAQPQASAAQSAPDEREAFEAAVAAVNERGWTTSTDLARQIWDSCAAWQRAQSAPVVPGTNCDQLGSRLAQLASWASNTVEFLRNADVSSGVCCCGDNMKGHADPMVSGHNPVDMWDHAVVELARELDSMLSAQAQPVAPSEQMPCPACDGKGELYHPHAGDEYRCESCDGSGEVEKTAARQEQGDEVRRLREALEEIRHANMNAPVSESNAGCIKRIKQIAERALVGSPSRLPTYPHIIVGMPAALHPDTQDLLKRFTHALAIKLRAAEAKYGYSNGWKDSGWMDECREKLAEHMAKGDPRDVAAYCAFLWHHGESTASKLEAKS